MKSKIITKVGIFVIIALAVLVSFIPNKVNAAQTSENDGTEVVEKNDSSSKKVKKSKSENLTDDEKEALKAERRAKYENMTDEEKEALKNKKPEKKERKNNNAVNSQKAEQ